MGYYVNSDGTVESGEARNGSGDRWDKSSKNITENRVGGFRKISDITETKSLPKTGKKKNKPGQVERVKSKKPIEKKMNHNQKRSDTNNIKKRIIYVDSKKKMFKCPICDKWFSFLLKNMSHLDNCNLTEEQKLIIKEQFYKFGVIKKKPKKMTPKKKVKTNLGLGKK